jgi:ATP-dependent DNA helicase RecG
MELELLKLEERIRTGLELGESHFREFKSAFQRQSNGSLTPRDFKGICKNIAEVLVAFANADGGELYVGVEDDCSVSGIPHDQTLIGEFFQFTINLGTQALIIRR